MSCAFLLLLFTAARALHALRSSPLAPCGAAALKETQHFYYCLSSSAVGAAKAVRARQTFKLHDCSLKRYKGFAFASRIASIRTNRPAELLAINLINDCF